ncbi:HupE/UreJ family protein [Vibrio ulleungensis]|uniref:HupE/UreJ family protein n=1 Tax=Vibrio ulleungensis TaxID=2807619 RepID=A0ABS2HLJ7_9VIBR|nr:HupE/UreJ family protein [Vibrio ulleungensis]MBM7036747.1 HupE/UreJ family protein [Vibrio ulleungensis]
MRLKIMAVLALLAPVPAFAHSPIEGVGSFYNGLLHPVLVPSHLLLLIAVGIFLSQQLSEKRLVSFGMFSAMTLIGLALTHFYAPSLANYLLAFSLITGGLVAANLVLPLWIANLLLGSTGLMLGLDSSQDTLFDLDKWLILIGNAISMNFIVLNVMLVASRVRLHWQKIGLRIIGSWVTTIALLMLAFSAFVPPEALS